MAQHLQHCINTTPCSNAVLVQCSSGKGSTGDIECTNYVKSQRVAQVCTVDHILNLLNKEPMTDSFLVCFVLA